MCVCVCLCVCVCVCVFVYVCVCLCLCVCGGGECWLHYVRVNVYVWGDVECVHACVCCGCGADSVGVNTRSVYMR